MMFLLESHVQIIISHGSHLDAILTLAQRPFAPFLFSFNERGNAEKLTMTMNAKSSWVSLGGRRDPLECDDLFTECQQRVGGLHEIPQQDIPMDAQPLSALPTNSSTPKEPLLSKPPGHCSPGIEILARVHNAVDKTIFINHPNGLINEYLRFLALKLLVGDTSTIPPKLSPCKVRSSFNCCPP